MSLRHLKPLFQPNSIAIIDTSNESGHMGSAVVRNLLYSGFEGPILPVTRMYKAVAGILAYPDVASLPMAPDVAVLSLSLESVPIVISELGRRGTKAAIILSDGRSRMRNEGGGTAQEAILEAAKCYDVRVLGPDSLGLLVPGSGVNASLADQPALPGDLAFVSQSGAMCAGVLDWARAKGIGFSHFVSLGDCADIGFGDVLDYLCTEPATRAILLHIDTLYRRGNFMSAARAAARNKVVVALKTRMAQVVCGLDSAVGALASSDEVLDAALRRIGILRVFDIEELFAAADTLTRARPLKGERLAIMTNGDGIGSTSADALIQGGGSLAPLSAQTIKKLDAVLPGLWSWDNAVNILRDATAERYAETLRILIEADEVDAVLVMHAPTAVVASTAVAKAVVKTVRECRGKVLTCWFGADGVAPARKLFARAGIPNYESPSMAVRAFLHIVHYQRNQELLMETPPSVPIGFTPSIGMARTTIRSVLGDGREVMNDAEAKLVLEAYGVPTLTTRCASDPLQAAALAKDIGFPVAIKLLSDKVSTLDYAGVPLTLNTAEAVQDAAERMISRLHKRFPKARSQGFLVRKAMQRPSAHELLIGVTTDPILGPLLLFGRGGSQANVIGDIAVALPPLNVALARELISRTRIYKYKALQGYRGHTAADINAICLTLTKLSQLIIDIPHIAQLEINPLLSDGYGVLVVEAYIRLQHNPSPVEERLAIRPYPQELEELFTLKTGRVVLLRPIRPEDEPEHQVFFSKIAFEDLHSRFFGSVGKFSHSHMAHLTQIDYEREMAFIATAPGENSKPETLGEVRTITDSDNSIAEFSVMVRSDQKKKGLGRRLTEKVIDYCRSRGTQKLVGHVLIRNHAAVCMLNSLGFQHQSVPDDPQIYEVWLNLEIARAERACGFSSATQARLRKANKSN